MVYQKLENIDHKLAAVERILIAEEKVSPETMKELMQSSKEIKAGKYLSEKELFKLLGE